MYSIFSECCKEEPVLWENGKRFQIEKKKTVDLISQTLAAPRPPDPPPITIKSNSYSRLFGDVIFTLISSTPLFIGESRFLEMGRG